MVTVTLSGFSYTTKYQKLNKKTENAINSRHHCQNKKSFTLYLNIVTVTEDSKCNIL